MLKVMIADDEPIIVRGLKKLISWEEFGLVVVDCARDGQELWEKVKEQFSDIVISDICMPGITGLEFLKRLKEEKIETQVIFISGYQKFEYAQEAVRLGAIDYILKPVLKTAMEEAIQKALQRFQNQERLKLFQEEKNELQELVSKMNLNNEFTQEELYKSFCKMGIDYKGKMFVCVNFYLSKEIEKKLKQEKYGKMELVKFSVFNQIQRFFRECKKGFSLKRDNECLHILCIFGGLGKEEFIENYIKKVIEEIEQEMGIVLLAGVGSFSKQPTEFTYLYNSSKFAYEMRYFLDEKIICADNIHKKFSLSFEDYDRLQKKIVNGLVTRESETEVMEDFKACIDLVKNLHYGNRYAVINRCILFAGSLYDSLKEYGVISSESDEKKQAEFMESLRTADTFLELKEIFLQYYKDLTEQLREKNTMWDNPAIAQVVEYIKSNYEKDINIQKMAEVVCVSPVYFSALFKKTTGRNFKEFLTDVRMEAAKKLVITTDLKTYAIAEKVGYQNPRQFTDKFKQYYGCRPMEYKKKLMKKSVDS